MIKTHNLLYSDARTLWHSSCLLHWDITDCLHLQVVTTIDPSAGSKDTPATYLEGQERCSKQLCQTQEADSTANAHLQATHQAPFKPAVAGVSLPGSTITQCSRCNHLLLHVSMASARLHSLTGWQE